MRLIGVSLSNANLYGASLSYSTFINGTLSWRCVCVRGPFSLSRPFLSECQLLSDRKKTKTNQTSVFVSGGCDRRLLTVPNINRKSRPAFSIMCQRCVTLTRFPIRPISGEQEPSASESGYSRDAIFSWLHFDNSGDFSIFLSTLKRPWKRFYFDWVALLQRKEQKKSFFYWEKKSWSVFVSYLCRMRCLAFLFLGLTVVLYIFYKYIYKYKLLYIAFWAIAACLWVPTLPKRFLFFCVN